MKKGKTKYTKDLLEPLVEQSKNFSEVARKLGLGKSGAAPGYIKKAIELHKIDTSHFLGYRTMCGYNNPFIQKIKLKAEDILVSNSDFNSTQLRRAFKEIGVEYKCYECGISKWKDMPISLQIHHIDGNKRNNLKENLVYLCPNCHSQTHNWGSKNRKHGGIGVKEAQ